MGVPDNPPGRRKLSGKDIQKFLLVSCLAGAIVAAMALPLAGTVAFATKEATATFDSLPTSIKNSPPPQRTYMLAADGKTRIATLYSENRVVVPLDQISPLLQQAIISTEDSRFYDHKGVDIKGAMRAVLRNADSGSVQQGSSTITMQYVRNMLITGAQSKEEIEAARVQTITRKLQEMKYALAVEKEMSKAEILQGYLNIAYFGSGAYGAEAAAKRYFNTTAKNLTLVQAATIAGLVQNPVGYDPTLHPEISQVRRNVVLDRMVVFNQITKEQAEEAKALPIKKTLNTTQQTNGCVEGPYPFYCEYVLAQIRNDPRYGATPKAREDMLKNGAMVIHTALDVNKMEAAQDAVNNAIPPKDGSKKAVAAALVEPGTGKVQALAENRKWGTKGDGFTTYNYAVDAVDGGTTGMPAGSTFKIFTLAAALEKGINPNTRISSPQKKTFNDKDWGCDGQRYKPYTVKNSTGAGTFNMWQATALSINTFFVELERRAGVCRTVDVAERMGVTLGNGKPLYRYPSFTLGSMEVSPLALAGAYATFANHGIYCRNHAVVNITNLEGTTMFQDDGGCTRAITRGVADATTAMLTGVLDGNVKGRTGSAMSLGREAAGKTGTTDDNSSVWFAGYTPQLAAAVWVGDPRGGFKYPLQDIRINGTYYDKVHGSDLPGPIWKSIMNRSLANESSADFNLEAKYNLKTARKGGGGNDKPEYDPDNPNTRNYNPYYNRNRTYTYRAPAKSTAKKKANTAKKNNTKKNNRDAAADPYDFGFDFNFN